VVDGAVRAASADPAVFDRMTALGLGDGIFDVRTVARIGMALIVGDGAPRVRRASVG
jgi:menaquinone-9 beta-reductase